MNRDLAMFTAALVAVIGATAFGFKLLSDEGERRILLESEECAARTGCPSGMTPRIAINRGCVCEWLPVRPAGEKR